MRELSGFLLIAAITATTIALVPRFIAFDRDVARASKARIQGAEEESRSVPVDLGLGRPDFSAIFGKPVRCYEHKPVIAFSPD